MRLGLVNLFTAKQLKNGAMGLLLYNQSKRGTGYRGGWVQIYPWGDTQKITIIGLFLGGKTH